MRKILTITIVVPSDHDGVVVALNGYQEGEADVVFTAEATNEDPLIAGQEAMDDCAEQVKSNAVHDMTEALMKISHTLNEDGTTTAVAQALHARSRSLILSRVFLEQSEDARGFLLGSLPKLSAFQPDDDDREETVMVPANGRCLVVKRLDEGYIVARFEGPEVDMNEDEPERPEWDRGYDEKSPKALAALLERRPCPPLIYGASTPELATAKIMKLIQE